MFTRWAGRDGWGRHHDQEMAGERMRVWGKNVGAD